MEKIFPAFLECYVPQNREDLEWKTLVKLAKWHHHLETKGLGERGTVLISPIPTQGSWEIVLRHSWVLCGGWDTWEDAGALWRMTTRSKFQTGSAAHVRTQWGHKVFVLSQVRNSKLSGEKEIVFFQIYYKSLQQKHYILLLNFSQEEHEPNTFVFRAFEKCLKHLFVRLSGLRNRRI